MIPLRDENPSSTTPWITYALIGINSFVFLVQLGLSGQGMKEAVMQFGFVPARATAALQGEAGLMAGVGVPMVTSMFMHGSFVHLIGNMLYLYIFGDNVEDGLGHYRFIAFYVACGLLAQVAQYLIAPSSAVPVIGASGAIAGVLGAYLLNWPRARIVTLLPIFFIITFVRLPALVVLGFWFVLQFFQGVISVGAASGGGVAYWAHIGGFAAGMGLIKLLPWKRPPGRPARGRRRPYDNPRYWR